MLPGTTEPQPVPLRPADYADGGETMSFRQALTVVRRRALLILFMTAIGAGIGLFLAWDTPAMYTASAMLRMAGERQTLTGDEEEAKGLDPHRRPAALAHPAHPEPDRRGRGGGQPRPAAVQQDRGLLHRRSRSHQGRPAGGRRLGGAHLRRARRERPPGRPGGHRPLRPADQSRHRPVHGHGSAGGRDRDPRPHGPRSRRSAGWWAASAPPGGKRPTSSTSATSRKIPAWPSASSTPACRPSSRSACSGPGSAPAGAASSSPSSWPRPTARWPGPRPISAASGAGSSWPARRASSTRPRRRSSSWTPRWRSSRPTGRPSARCSSSSRAPTRATRDQALRALATSPAIAENPTVTGLYQNQLKYQQRLDSMTTGPWRGLEGQPRPGAAPGSVQEQPGSAGRGGRQPGPDHRCPHPRAHRPAQPHRRVDPDPPGHGRGGDAAGPAGELPSPAWATSCARTSRRPAWRRRSRPATSTSWRWPRCRPIPA